MREGTRKSRAPSGLDAVRIGVWNFVWLGPGEFGMEGDFTGSGSLTEIGRCLRLNHELPAPFRVKDPEYVASKERDRFPVQRKERDDIQL